MFMASINKLDLWKEMKVWLSEQIQKNLYGLRVLKSMHKDMHKCYKEFKPS